MRVLLACDALVPTDRGPARTSWLLHQALGARGHSLTIVLTTRSRHTPTGGEFLLVLPSTVPDPHVRDAATRRLSSSSSALPTVQMELLRRLGPCSESGRVAFSGIDCVIGVGLASPHVRGIMARAAGRCCTALHLDASEAPLLHSSVLRSELRLHSLVVDAPENPCWREQFDLPIHAFHLDPAQGAPTDGSAGDRQLRGDDDLLAYETLLTLSAAAAPPRGPR